MNVFVIARPGEIFWEGTTNKTKHRKQEFMQHKWEIHMKRQKLVWSHPKFKIWPTVDSRNLFESYWIREFHLWILNLLPKSLQNAMNFRILIQDSWSPIASNGFQERSRNSSAPSMVPVSWMEHRKINGKSMVNQWQINGDWFIMVNIYGISMEYLWNIYDTSIEYDFHVANTMNQLHQKDYSLSIGWWSLKKTRQWPNNVAENLWLASFCRTSGCGDIPAAPLADCWEVSPYEWPDDTDCVWFFTLVFTLVFFPSWQYFTSTI